MGWRVYESWRRRDGSTGAPIKLELMRMHDDPFVTSWRVAYSMGRNGGESFGDDEQAARAYLAEQLALHNDWVKHEA